MRKFIQIKDKELFEELSAIADNGGGEDEIWQGLFSDYEQKNLWIPCLCGGLDHIDRTKNSFRFYDIGSNYKDNSFVIFP